MANQCQNIVVGDLRSVSLARTGWLRLRSGWGMLATQLHYKGTNAGRSVKIVSERDTGRARSGCGASMGPAVGITSVRGTDDADRRGCMST